jgi:pimeloyl-ACP methyl ester carboxylesterase
VTEPATVLLIHSGGFTSRQWRRLAESLTPRYRVLAPDLLGYGAPWPAGTPFHFRQDIAMLTALIAGEPHPVHVVGHSYGGFLALQLALAHPSHVRSLAVYEPVAFGILDEQTDAWARESLEQLRGYEPGETGVDEAWLESFVDWWNGAGAWQKLPEPTRQAFRDVGWKVSQEVESLGADRTDRAGYARITVPTLLLGGERTQPVELRTLEKLAAALPAARLELFPDLGHMGPITHAPLVNAAIAHHLDAITAPAETP